MGTQVCHLPIAICTGSLQGHFLSDSVRYHVSLWPLGRSAWRAVQNSLPIRPLLPSSGQCMVGTNVTSCVLALLFRDQQTLGETLPCQWLSLLPVSVTGLSSFRHMPVHMKTLYAYMFSWAVYLIFGKCPWKRASCGDVTWRACSG